MANGIKAFRQIQLNREDVQGASTTDYTPWRGTGTIKDTRVSVFPNEDIGIFGGVDRQYFPQLGSELVLEGEATYEQIAHIFDAGIYNATPTTDTGTGTGYIRTYTSPIATSDAKESTDLMTYSVLGGDNNEVEEFHFGFIQSFNLSGSGGEALKLTATMVGRETTTDAAFDTVTIPTVEEILFSKGKLYLDATSTDFGTTQVSNTLIGMSLDWNTGWHAVYSADGRADFGFIKQVMPEIVLQVTFEHNASASAEKAYWRAGTSRLLRLRFDGSALTAAGAYTYKALIINLAGKWDTFDALGEQDGNDIVTGTFRARYNATAGKFAEAIVVNEVATMPG